LDGFFRNFGNAGDFVVVALMRVIPALICITIHELAHGLAAYKLGDRTAKEMGRLTLNPIKHIDPLGLLMMLIVRFGWAKPVPVDINNFKYPKWYMAITAIAGPVSNLILAAFVMFILGLLSTSLGMIIIFNTDYPLGVIIPISLTVDAGFIVGEIIMNTIIISVALAIFNMLPIPPLDGSKVLFSLLPEKTYFGLMRYERYGILILLLVIYAGPIFGIDIFSRTIGQLLNTIVSNLSSVYEVALRLVN